MSENKLSSRIVGDLYERWPKLENGEPEEPVYLCTCKSIDMGDVIRINMLESFGIPCLLIYPGDGSFGKVILGMSGEGTKIYVPKCCVEDAVYLCMNIGFEGDNEI